MYLELDVHLKSISYCLMNETGRIHKEGILPAGMPEVAQLVQRHGVTDATLEACGNWQPYYDALRFLMVNTALAHPNRVRESRCQLLTTGYPYVSMVMGICS